MEQLLIANSVLIWVFVLFNFLLTLALIRRVNAQTKKGLKVGQLAPPFKAVTLEGDTVTLENFAGRSTVFFFISPTCSPCREKLPSLEALLPAARRVGVDFVLVSDKGVEETRAFLDQLNVHMLTLIAPFDSNPFSRDYRITETPSYCMIDRLGRVASVGYPGQESSEWRVLAQKWDSTIGTATT